MIPPARGCAIKYTTKEREREVYGYDVSFFVVTRGGITVTCSLLLLFNLNFYYSCVLCVYIMFGTE